MTENSQKKKPLIIESSDSTISSDKSSASQKSSNTLPSYIKRELDAVFKPTTSSLSSSSVPSSSSSPIPSTKSSSSSDSLKISDNLEAEYKKLNCDDEN